MRVRFPGVRWAWLLIVVLWARPAQAGFDEARRADDEQRFADALALYDEARTAAPTSPLAPQADARAEYLRTHAEGDFRPLAELERVRRDPVRSSEGKAIDQLVTDANAFPPGRVRIETWMLAGQAYARRLGRPADAEVLFARVAEDPLADPEARGWLTALAMERGDLDAATWWATGNEDLEARVSRLRRRHRVHDASLLVLGALVAFVAVAVARRRSELARVGAALRKAGVVVIAICIYLAGAGALLASGYEAGTAAPFVALGVGLAPLLLMARIWSVTGSASPAPRAGRAVVCAASALAIAFLVLERIDASYLAGVGL